uniref:MP protein n=1 Tax=Citrus psorosis virus TaxID=73561 RepID=A0A4Y5QX25_9VIRU|nr:MP protein [Citrus psorosis virus]
MSAVSFRSASKRMTGTECVTRISANTAINSIVKKGELNVISLKDGNTADLEGINDILLDYKRILKNEIKTAVSPITMKLKKDEHKKKLKLGTLKTITDKLKKLGGECSHPFIQFYKVQCMYIPLFSKVEGDNGEITVSLIDDGKEAAGQDPIIQSITFDASQMAMVELSMNFFVEKKDMDFIGIHINAENVPVQDRAYGSINLAFFTNEQSVPMMQEEKKSSYLMIDAVNRPKDITKSSVFKSIGDKVSEEINQKRDEYKRKMIENEKMRRKEGKSVRIETETRSSSSSGGETLLEEARKSVSLNLSKFLADQRRAPPPPLEKRTFQWPCGIKMLTMMDTGSSSHYFFSKSINPTSIQKNFGGVPLLEVEQAKLSFETFGNKFLLKDVFMFSDQTLGDNILSYTLLKEEGHIDGMRTAGDDVLLEKDGEVVMILDSRDEGRMWIKDDVWAEVTEHGTKSAREHCMKIEKNEIIVN